MTARRRHALIAALVAGLVAIGVIAASGGDVEPPPDRAAALVPAGALLYLHLATDRAGGDGDEASAAGVAERVPLLARLRDALLARAGASGGGFDFESDVRPWLGEEAAAALVGPSARDARSLLLFEAGDETGARAFMERLAGAAEPTLYRDAEIVGTPALASALVDGFVVVGPLDLVRATIDVHAGASPALAGDREYVGLRARLPAGRLVSAFASRPGLQGLLAGPASPLAAFPGVDDLGAAALGVSVEGQRVRMSVRGVAPRAATASGDSCAAPAPTERPSAADVPAAALVYAEVPDGACFLRGQLASTSSPLGGSLRRFAGEIRSEADVDLLREIVPLLAGPTTLAVTREGEAAPVATLVARGVSGDALSVLERLQPALVRLAENAGVAPPLSPGGTARVPAASAPGQAPGFTAQEIDGGTAFSAALAPGFEPSYGSFDGRLAVSTALEGVEQAAGGPATALADSSDYRLLLGGSSPSASGTVFLDLDRLLALGDEVGLGSEQSYAAARADLRSIDAVAAVFSREGSRSDAEVLLKTP